VTIIDRAFASPGRQIFIFGDRGVGKTSPAVTAANRPINDGFENRFRARPPRLEPARASDRSLLQRPLPDGRLRIAATGDKRDGSTE
jgi:hypothetical protein